MIGIPCTHEEHSGRVPDFEVNEYYVKAVLTAGGLPFLLPCTIPEADWPSLVGHFDGFLFIGGGDIEPWRYGAGVAPASYGFSPMRDAFELGLLPRVIESAKPVLAICRGLQVLNVALGGTLVGDIASELPHAGKHDWYPRYPRGRHSHTVTITPESCLYSFIERRELQVNSLHHQSVKRIGRGLRVSATAPDGVVEALELPEHPFALGVQWHPEHLQQDPSQKALFEQLIALAARKR